MMIGAKARGAMLAWFPLHDIVRFCGAFASAFGMG